MEVVRSFFGWPDGGVWSNLLASALTVLPGLVWHHRSVRRSHTADTQAQTQELKDHIDSKLGGEQ